MNLRQQFFWKVLIGLCSLIVLSSLIRSYYKYTEYREYNTEYQKELEVKENKDMERKADFITQKQDSRINLNIDLLSIEEILITDHSKAGIQTNSKFGWDSNEPIFRGTIGDAVLIDYREDKDGSYKINDTIGDTEMRIKSFTIKPAQSVTIEYPNGDFKTFYLPSNEELKK